MAARRRGNREGSLRQRPNGTWEASVMVGFHPITGARNVKYFYGKTRDEARRKMQKYLDDRERGLDVDSEYTVSEWLDIFLSLRAIDIKAATYENYVYTAAHIKRYPEVGDKKIRNVRPMDIERMLIDLREKYSDATISQIRGLLYGAFHKALGNGLVTSNPVLFVSKMRKRPPNEKAVFTKEEFTRLIRELPNDKIGHSVRLLLLSGMRTQELLGLMPEHIEPDGSAIHIRQAVSMVRGHVSISTPKSYDSFRTIIVPSIGRESALYLRNTADRFIWQSPTEEKPINPSTFRKYYRACLDEIPGIPILPPHNCRHSYVSFLQAEGVDLPTIQSLVGHSTQAMVMHYTHINPAVKENAAEKLSVLIGEIEKESALPL